MMDVADIESLIPTNNDVLFGRGRGPMNHKGNQNLHKIVLEYREQYLASTRTEKANIALMIIDEIQSSGGRFLQRMANTGFYQLSAAKDIREKVTHLLRERPKIPSNTSASPKTKTGPSGKVTSKRMIPPKVPHALSELHSKQEEIFQQLLKDHCMSTCKSSND